MKRECSPATASPQTPGLAGGFALGPALASHDKARQVASGLGWEWVGRRRGGELGELGSENKTQL
jgi:hypothetical protein